MLTNTEKSVINKSRGPEVVLSKCASFNYLPKKFSDPYLSRDPLARNLCMTALLESEGWAISWSPSPPILLGPSSPVSSRLRGSPFLVWEPKNATDTRWVTPPSCCFRNFLKFTAPPFDRFTVKYISSCGCFFRPQFSSVRKGVISPDTSVRLHNGFRSIWYLSVKELDNILSSSFTCQLTWHSSWQQNKNGA